MGRHQNLRQGLFYPTFFVKENSSNKLFYYVDGKLILSKTPREFPSIKPVRPEKVINEKIITLDLETVRDAQGNQRPYLLCWYSASEKNLILLLIIIMISILW